MVYTHEEVLELLRFCLTKEKVTLGIADLI